MKHLKRVLCLLLALCMCAGILAACAEEQEKPDDADPCEAGHTPGAWSVVTAATESAEGKRQQICSVCGAVIQTSVIPMLTPNAFPNVTFSGGTTVMDLSAFTVIYPDKNPLGDSLTSTFKNAVADLASKISFATGATIPTYSNQANPGDADAYEIVVGVTNNADSKELATAFASQHGYAIHVVGNKILIQGSTTMLTMKAMTLFADLYLVNETPTQSYTLYNKADCTSVEMMELASTGNIPWKIVRSADLDEDPAAEYGDTGGRSYYDYPVDAVVTIQNKLASLTASTLSSDIWVKDDVAKSNMEIVVGKTDRDASKQYLAQLKAYEYGIFVDATGSVVLIAESDAGLMYSVNRFVDYLVDSRCDNGAGGYAIMLPAGLEEIGVPNKNWKTDFPMPEGPVLSTAVDVDDNSVEFVFISEDLTAAVFSGYCDVLKQNGYTVLQQSDAEGSYFATLANYQTGTSLYVAFNAFAHADELPEGEKYANATPTLRIVSSNLDSVNLPTAQMLSFTPFERATNATTTLTAIAMQNAGAGYVMRLEDGSFIMMDGGYNSRGSEAENVWKILTELHRQAHGELPSTENPIRIAAWVMSHNHGDHYGMLRDLTAAYAASGLLQIDYVLGNFPAPGSYYNTPESTHYMQDYMATFAARLPKPFTYIKVHTGQKLWFANVEIEVLFTHEDFYPHSIVAFNDSSTVVRFNIYKTKGTEITSNGTISEFLFMGDNYRYGGRWMCATYGDYLQSEMVSLAHHGGPGSEWFLYTKVAAKALWVPNTTAGFNGWVNRNDWIGKANKQAATNSTVQYILCANFRTSGSIEYYKNVTVAIKTAGPDYDNATNPGGNGDIAYGKINSKGQVATGSSSSSGNSQKDIGKKN